MTKHLTLILLLLAATISVGVAETTGNLGVFTSVAGKGASAVEWVPAAGPVSTPAPADSEAAGRVQGLTVHEWGTFTSVAGVKGTAIDWLPAGGPTDLPCFVNMSGAGPKGLVVSEQGGRANKAMVRMETPVLYFYSPKEQTVNVKVSFPRGLMTEWYPSAKLQNEWETIRNFPSATSVIEWNNVKVRPGATESFPLGEASSHYYAARRTGSAPLQVGTQHEKFLFYRGIASFNPPISAKVTAKGKIEVRNLVGNEIPAVVLFENRGGKVGYRIHQKLSGGSAILELPELNDSISSLQQDLEGILQVQGMFPPEARAMVETWKDTWFEQGTRVFYIVPSATVDSILPLEISPKPLSVARAFVGRMEVLTPATQEEVRLAIRNNDRVTLETYGRFLEPILNVLADGISAEERAQANSTMASIRAGYLAGVNACKEKTRW